jgi:hypothetical protein
MSDAVPQSLTRHHRTSQGSLRSTGTLATTQTYITVNAQIVIERHRAFIAQRRTLPSDEEYREPSDGGWDEFMGDFEMRKVALVSSVAATEPTAKPREPACGARCSARPSQSASARGEEGNRLY